MAQSASIIVERDGAVTTVTLNRPHVLNAMDTPMHHALQAAFDAFAADRSQRICVVTGAGERAFCAGSDLKYATEMAAAGRREEMVYPANGYAGLTQRFDLDKPIIAAVNGIALGGGFEIALACDLIIASDTARFGLPEPLVGAMALGGGVHRLARQIGLKQATGMVLTGRSIDAREALRLGVVNEVVAASDLQDAVGRWVEAILRCSPAALAASKQSMMRGLDEPSLGAAMERQENYPAFVALRQSPDSKEGPRAFAEKRAPRWADN
ncbi:MAG: enoyl-CoA hydratase/isomerase family protein [Sphingomonadaceae bacterium]|nr:enoyl-CoA hydratase/isomerase family protein [Sphingomonadaceae bacterium]